MTYLYEVLQFIYQLESHFISYFKFQLIIDCIPLILSLLISLLFIIKFILLNPLNFIQKALKFNYKVIYFLIIKLKSVFIWYLNLLCLKFKICFKFVKICRKFLKIFNFVNFVFIPLLIYVLALNHWNIKFL